jgi:hypothetical protein
MSGQNLRLPPHRIFEEPLGLVVIGIPAEATVK